MLRLQHLSNIHTHTHTLLDYMFRQCLTSYPRCHILYDLLRGAFGTLHCLDLYFFSLSVVYLIALPSSFLSFNPTQSQPCGSFVLALFHRLTRFVKH